MSKKVHRMFVDCKDRELIMKAKQHAAHVLLWSKSVPSDTKAADMDVETECRVRANVIMQLRFDGKFGFPGGIIDELEGKSVSLWEEFEDLIRTGLKREVYEEMCVPLEDLGPGTVDLLYSCCSISDPGSVEHFFTCEVSECGMSKLESCFPLTTKEVMGVVRVPLYVMRDGKKGLPTFLLNKFAGDSDNQLVRGCVALGFITEQEIETLCGRDFLGIVSVIQ